MAEAISIKEGVTIVIWGIERLDNIKLASGIEYKYGDDVDSDRCIHIFQRANHFTSLIPTEAPPPPKKVVHSLLMTSPSHPRTKQRTNCKCRFLLSAKVHDWPNRGGEKVIKMKPQLLPPSLRVHQHDLPRLPEMTATVNLTPMLMRSLVAPQKLIIGAKLCSTGDMVLRRLRLHVCTHWHSKPTRTSYENDSILLAIK